MACISSAKAQQTTSTLDVVKKRGVLHCGVSGTTVGFSLPNKQGELQGIDADYCRLIAAGVLGDSRKVKFVLLTPTNRFTALQTGEVDVLNMSATWTASREASLGVNFANIYFYDTQGIMVHADSGISTAKQLDGGSVCVNPGSSAEQTLMQFSRTLKIKVSPMLVADPDQQRAAFTSKRCDALMTDLSSLASFRYAQGDSGKKYKILEGKALSREPLGSVVRANDSKWFNVVRWAHFIVVTAEDFGIDSKNVDQMLSSKDPSVRQLLGVEGDTGKSLGVDPKWGYNMIKQVGNYGEIWSRSMLPLGLVRGQNNLWSNGGLQYAPPYR